MCQRAKRASAENPVDKSETFRVGLGAGARRKTNQSVFRPRRFLPSEGRGKGVVGFHETREIINFRGIRGV